MSEFTDLTGAEMYELSQVQMMALTTARFQVHYTPDHGRERWIQQVYRRPYLTATEVAYYEAWRVMAEKSRRHRAPWEIL